jgi:hypothetical protein
MSSNSKKKKYILKLLQNSFDKSKTQELTSEHVSLLQQDTKGCKLYKYRTFDANGFALYNLITQTLHCSKRSCFNDPFDCRVGIDVESFASAFIDIDTERIARLFKEFFEIVVHRASKNHLSPEDLVVVESWCHSDILKRFCNKLNDPQMTSKRLNSIFAKQPEVIYELMYGAMTDGKYKDAFEKKKLEFEDRIAKLLSDSKARIPSKNMYEIEAKSRGLNLDVDQIDLVSALSKEKDPEGSKKILDWFSLMDQKMAELFDGMLLVGSLCTDYINPLMWAHYADSHKGFCVEYDFSNVKEDDLLPLPVTYSKQIVKMPWKYCMLPDGTKSPEFSSRLIQAVLTKHDVWKYENEWRILLPANAESNHKMPRVSCVYLGAFCSEENEQIILEIAKDKFSVKRMTVDRGQFAFHTKTIYDLHDID